MERALGYMPATSPLPQADHHTVGLIALINGMGLTPSYANDLRTRAGEIGYALAYGRVANAGVALDALARKVAADAGRPGRLTAAQAAQLSTAIAQIRSHLGL